MSQCSGARTLNIGSTIKLSMQIMSLQSGEYIQRNMDTSAILIGSRKLDKKAVDVGTKRESTRKVVEACLEIYGQKRFLSPNGLPDTLNTCNVYCQGKIST